MSNKKADFLSSERPKSRAEGGPISTVAPFVPTKDLFEYFKPRRLYTIEKLMEDKGAQERIQMIKNEMIKEVKKVLYAVPIHSSLQVRKAQDMIICTSNRGGPVVSDLGESEVQRFY